MCVTDGSYAEKGLDIEASPAVYSVMGHFLGILSSIELTKNSENSTKILRPPDHELSHGKLTWLGWDPATANFFLNSANPSLFPILPGRWKESGKMKPGTEGKVRGKCTF